MGEQDEAEECDDAGEESHLFSLSSFFPFLSRYSEGSGMNE